MERDGLKPVTRLQPKPFVRVSMTCPWCNAPHGPHPDPDGVNASYICGTTIILALGQPDRGDACAYIAAMRAVVEAASNHRHNVFLQQRDGKPAAVDLQADLWDAVDVFEEANR